ncbi:beta-1,4-glucuronyltransferase 1-like isoform X1 [Diorhabda carinulata]|uniref:beta-1,4-glucuronyltransferase 1-like isoform X1 n=2 Tax=Diorhabda carinulata TaxID=1163345 RepID=UPI0025A0E4E9|nr:beta-1,4-glucuronyltransferase 1-like isoform X1 [Diorhabda carinulata]
MRLSLMSNFSVSHRQSLLLYIFLCICFSCLLLTHLFQVDTSNYIRNEFSEKSVEYRGNYLVLKNFIRATRKFKNDESITLTTPGDFRFLDNILPLVDRWRGPISVALYAPGDDFYSTTKSVAYLRKCTTDLVEEFVTFHLFFDVDHMPAETGNIPLIEMYKDDFDCSQKPPYEILTENGTYKQKFGLFYPINVARNIAKLNAQTHFVFPSDIELYPTRKFIPKFLNFVQHNPQYFDEKSKNVFVLPIFEILEEYAIPESKTTLRLMHKNRTAFGFHAKVCPQCHNVPKQREWLATEETDDLNIFTSAKRQREFGIWEPFFVCTQKEPLWDERLNWEGQGNKMCQAFHLCILDYNFLVFDNAFLIHKPGVKKKKIQNIKYTDQQTVNNKILRHIQKELRRIYGTSNGDTSHCYTH